MSLPRVTKKWWKEATVYQIYPASFKDSNGDGLGDIQGIISEIPHVASLGADAIWLSPIYASPQKDMGYDVADYRDIHAPYGSLADVDELITKLHQHGIRLVMDLVVNHTSDQHPWFEESRTSITNDKRDYYFWREPRYNDDGQRMEPNNWASIFGGSAWTYDEQSGQYYLALFLPSQPDLNWECEAVREAVYSDMRFWLDRGVDGFRIDSMDLMSKNPSLPDASIRFPGERYQPAAEHYASGPRMHDYMQEMRTRVFDHYDAMNVGELGASKDDDSVMKYVAASRKELDMVFTGDIVDMDFGPDGKYDHRDFHVSQLREITRKWQTMMPRFDGWNSVYLDNHDSGRSLSRYASDEPQFRAEAAKMLATYLCTLAGTPFLLAGQEIGMANLGKEYKLDTYIDLEGRNHYNAVLKSRGGDESSMVDVMREMQLKARDHGRLPMQWSDAPNAGFCKEGVKPWMTVNKDYPDWNVASQVGDADSVLSYWKKALAFRKDSADTIIYGNFEMLETEVTSEKVVGYERSAKQGDSKTVVLLNFSKEPAEVPAEKYASWQKVLGNGPNSGVKGGRIALQAFESLVLRSSHSG